MTDENKTEEIITRRAIEIKVVKPLALPTQLRQRLALLEKTGCTVSYELVAESLLNERFKDVVITGPATVVEPAWQKLLKDLGMKVTLGADA